MRSVSPPILEVILGEKIRKKNEECETCGSDQFIRGKGDCFGCRVEKVANLSYNDVCKAQASENVDGHGRRYFSLAHFHHDKRAGTRARSEAQLAQTETYYGEACAECGCNLRDTRDGECRACGMLDMIWRHDRGDKRELAVGRSRSVTRGRLMPIMTRKVDRIVRQLAKDIGEHTYHGFACECGNTKRYTARGQCVACIKSRNTKKTPPKRGGSAVESFDYLFE